MSADIRPIQNQWVIATLVLGMLGLATTTILPDFAIQSQKPKVDAAPAADQSDLLYPSTPDSISKSLGIWSDPFEKLSEKLKFKSSDAPQGSKVDSQPITKSPTILDIINDQIGKTGKLLVVAKVVSGSDSEDGVESRRRHRHSVELALASSGFSMAFPDRMTFVEASYDYYHSSETHTHSKIDLPLKLYSNADGNAVLMVWIRDEHLGHYPMHSIAQLSRSFANPGDKIFDRSGFVVCGPNSSNTLSKIVDESGAVSSPMPKDFHGETLEFVKQWKLGTAIFNSVCTATLKNLEPKQLFVEYGDADTEKVRLIHTIGTDSELTKLLHRELLLRGREVTSSNSRTVLFVEASSQSYIEGLKKEFSSDSSNLVIIPYLRGVSDITAANNQITDYLDRTLASLHNSFSESVSGVGVFGTQDNDKLRIFEAARSIFPTAAFFTTELDARYSEPKYLRSCRNLLVASHFGLQCNCSWVADGMPSFRDGYQTSTFLATMLALKCFKESKQFQEANFFDKDDTDKVQDLFDICGRTNPDPTRKLVQPLLFEIGNSGPIQLSGQHLPSAVSIRQPDTRPSISGELAFLLRMLLFAGVLIAITFVIRAFSSGLSNALQEAKRTLDAVWKFFLAQSQSLQKKWSQLTEPAGTTKVDDEGLRSKVVPLVPDTQTIWFVCIVVLTLLNFLVAWASDISIDGEKITLLESTSIWPSVAMFDFVTILSSAIVLRLWLDSKFDRKLFTKGALLAGLLFLAIFAALGFTLVDEPPARGFFTRATATFSLWIAAVSLFLLASMSTISILKARKEISQQAKKLLAADKNSDDTKVVSRVQKLLRDSANYRQQLCNAMEVGERSSYTLMAPAALTIVLAVARLPLLDSWGIPRIWYAALMTPMVLSIVAAIVMRSEARRFRYEVTGLIDKQQSDLLGDCASIETADRDQFNDYLQKVNQQLGLINRLDKGPFASIYSDPILGGVLLVITAGLTGPMQNVTTWVLNSIPGIVI